MEAASLGRVFDRHLAFPRTGRARLSVGSLLDRLASREEAPLGHRVDALAWAESFFAIEASVGAHEKALTTIGAASDYTAVFEFELGEREYVVWEEADEVIVVSSGGTLVLDRTDALIARLHEGQRPRQAVEPASREERATFVSRSGDVGTLDPQVLAALLASTPARVEKAPKVSRVPSALASVEAVRWLPLTTPPIARREPASARPRHPKSSTTQAVERQLPASKAPMWLERRVPVAGAVARSQPSRTAVTVLVQRPSFELVERLKTRLVGAEEQRWGTPAGRSFWISPRTATRAVEMPDWIQRALTGTSEVRATARTEARAQLPRVEGERIVVMRVEGDAPDVSWSPLAREIPQLSQPRLISVDAMPATVLLMLYGALDRTAAWERVSPTSWSMPTRVLETPALLDERVLPVQLQRSVEQLHVVDAPRQASPPEQAFRTREPPRELHRQQALIEQRAWLFSLPFGADGGLRVGPEISRLAFLPVPVETLRRETSSVVINSEKTRSLVFETERIGVEYVTARHVSERQSAWLDPLRLAVSLRWSHRPLPVRIGQDATTFAEHAISVAAERAPLWRDVAPLVIQVGASGTALDSGDAAWILPPLVQVCERRVPVAYEESVATSSDEVLIPLPLWGRLPPAAQAPASRQTRIDRREIRTEWAPPESSRLVASVATERTATSASLTPIRLETVRSVRVREDSEASPAVMPGSARREMGPLRFRFPTTARWWRETRTASPAAVEGVLSSRSLSPAALVRPAPAPVDKAPRYMTAPGRERSTARTQPVAFGQQAAASPSFARASVESRGQSTLEIDAPTPALVEGPVDAVVDERSAAVGIDCSGDAVVMPQARMPASGRAPDMTLIAAIAPQAPSLEEMVNADRERALAKGRHNDAAPLATESRPEGLPLQGSVDAIAQRIYHRLKRRLQSDRERMGG